MATTKLSREEFNQGTSKAKRAAKHGTVFITDRGRPSHVLITVEEYQKLTQGQKSIVDLLGMPQAAEVEFEPPRMKGPPAGRFVKLTPGNPERIYPGLRQVT